MMYKLLIIDDESIERRAIRYLVETSKIDIGEIFEASNGLDAVKIALVEEPEICIVDIKMPGMNGHEAAQQILNINKETKVIFSTAYSYLDYAVKALQIGAIDFLIKPVNESALFKVLHKAIDQLYENDILKKQKEYLGKVEDVLEKRISHDLVNNFIDEEMIWFLDAKGINPDDGGKILFATMGKVIADELNDDIENELRKELSEIGYKHVLNINNQKLIIIIFDKNIEKDVENTIAKGVDGIFKLHEIETPFFSILEFQDLYQIESIVSSGSGCSEEGGRRIDGTDSFIAINNKTGNNVKEIDIICTYIKDNYAEKLTLDSIIENIGFSKFYISRLFKQHKGCSIIEYLIQVRIEKAKELLMQNEYSVKEISYMIGYSDPNYFSWAFKKNVGMSPVKYKYFNETVK